MANVESNSGEFLDLGKFKSIRCKETLGVEVCQINFNEGKFTISRKELNKAC